VLAPTLSTLPLLVRPYKETSLSKKSAVVPIDDEDNVSVERLAFWKAVQHYLERPVDLRNVAHAMVPIHFKQNSEETKAKKKVHHSPMLEVDLAVHDGVDDSEGDDPLSASDDGDCDDELNVRTKEDADCGKMLLIRMVSEP
jgi:hypothetical protein